MKKFILLLIAFLTLTVVNGQTKEVKKTVKYTQELEKELEKSNMKSFESPIVGDNGDIEGTQVISYYYSLKTENPQLKKVVIESWFEKRNTTTRETFYFKERATVCLKYQILEGDKMVSDKKIILLKANNGDLLIYLKGEKTTEELTGDKYNATVGYIQEQLALIVKRMR